MNQYTHLDIPYVPTHDRKNIIFPILVSSALKMITSLLVVNFFKTWRERERMYMAHHSCQALSLLRSDTHYTSLHWVCQRHWSLSLSWLSRKEPFCLDLLRWCFLSDHMHIAHYPHFDYFFCFLSFWLWSTTSGLFITNLFITNIDWFEWSLPGMFWKKDASSKLASGFPG